MTLYQGLSLLFGSGILTAVGSYFLKRIKDNDKKTESVRLGVQALLRDRLIHEYNKALDRGYAPIYAKDNFENMWKHYHNLGQNGVMDEIHNEYMSLPTDREEK
jgi:hypothetical protein